MRILRTAAPALVAVALALVLCGLCGTGIAAAAVGSPAACTGEIDLTLAFTQTGVSPGQSATVNLTAVNCTAQTVKATLIPYGLFTGPSNPGGVAQGCPAIDPIAIPVTFAPNGTYKTSFSYMVFPSCLATGFEAVDSFFDGTTGALITRGTGTIPVVQPVPPVGCHVVYTLQSEWQGGFSAALSITNTGLVADNGWKLTFTFGGDEKIGVVWGATGTQSGEAVTLVNLSYNATIAPGATLTGVGMTGTWTKGGAAPGSFAVNGTACT